MIIWLDIHNNIHYIWSSASTDLLLISQNSNLSFLSNLETEVNKFWKLFDYPISSFSKTFLKHQLKYQIKYMNVGAAWVEYDENIIFHSRFSYSH